MACIARSDVQHRQWKDSALSLVTGGDGAASPCCQSFLLDETDFLLDETQKLLRAKIQNCPLPAPGPSHQRAGGGSEPEQSTPRDSEKALHQQRWQDTVQVAPRIAAVDPARVGLGGRGGGGGRDGVLG